MGMMYWLEVPFEEKDVAKAVGDIQIVSNELQLDFDPISQNFVPTKTPYRAALKPLLLETNREDEESA